MWTILLSVFLVSALAWREWRHCKAVGRLEAEYFGGEERNRREEREREAKLSRQIEELRSEAQKQQRQAKVTEKVVRGKLEVAERQRDRVLLWADEIYTGLLRVVSDDHDKFRKEYPRLAGLGDSEERFKDAHDVSRPETGPSYETQLSGQEGQVNWVNGPPRRK